MMYYKIIDGQEVFNNGTSLKINGRWTSNPTPEMYEAEGWMPYTPPPFVPQPQDEPDFYDVVEAVKRMLSTDTDSLTDEEAIEVAALYPTWHSRLESGEKCKLNERLWDDGKLWKVITEHTPQADWRPADAVSLFVEVSIEEWPEIPEVIPSTAPWMKGQKGTWKGQHYICNMDNCVWNPEQHPAAWEIA